MRTFLTLFSLLFAVPLSLSAQTGNDATVPVDSLYREDQFYIGFTYNILTQLPEGVSFSGFSGGAHAGFIRDFPINERRNMAIGVGLGWSINTYGHTLFIGEEAGTGETIFLPLDELELDFNSNRFSTQSVELPLQFRWRTSTFD